MEMERVETGVDRMMSILEKKGKLSLAELSNQLKIAENTLQLWVDFLVEERVLGVEYKFTKPYVFLNKKKEKSAVLEDVPTVEYFKKEFFDGAKKRQIPASKIPDLWKHHLNEAIEKQRELFFREAKKRGIHNTLTLYNKYKHNLLSA